MDEINNIAKEYNLKVIEDAAHALGAYKGKSIGSISDFTCFSFQAIKHLTTADGGAICCRSIEDFDHAMRIRWFGIDRKNSKQSILREREYDVTELGYKYHLNNYSAALGLANLEDFNFIINRRKEIAGIYKNEFQAIDGFRMLEYLTDRESAYWLFTVLVERRTDFIKKLKSNGIPASVVHLRIDKNSIFGAQRKELTNQNSFNHGQVSIPIHSDLNEKQIGLIIQTIKEGW